MDYLCRTAIISNLADSYSEMKEKLSNRVHGRGNARKTDI